MQRTTFVLDEWSQPGQVLSRRPGARTVIIGDGLVAVEPQDPGDLLVAIDPDGTRRILGEIERPAGSNFAGYESIVAEPTGTRIAVSEVTYLSSGVNGRLVVIDSASGAEVVAADTDGGLFVVAWLDGDRLITMRSDIEPPDLQVRDVDTLEVVAEIPGWPVFGATVVGDDAWGVSRVLSFAVRSRPVPSTQSKCCRLKQPARSSRSTGPSTSNLPLR